MKAAEILEKVEQKKGAVKTLVYDSKFQVSADICVPQASIFKITWGVTGCLHSKYGLI